MIVRAPVVVTMEGAPIENGAIAISGDRINAIGSFDELKRMHDGEVVDLDGYALLPGLVNAHCHLDYTMLRGKIPRQRSFTDWVRAINAEKATLSPDDYLAAINAGFHEALRFGTTALVNLTAFPELISRVDTPVRTWWCAELIDVRPGSEPARLLASAREDLRGRRGGFAPHAPYTASTELYRSASRIASAENFLCTTHLAESFEEMQMFRYASGALYEFLASIERDMSDCGAETPFARGVRLCAGKARWIFAHLNELTDADFTLAANLAALNVAHCPRSHAYFQHTGFAYERLRDCGANVAIASDSLASSPDLSLLGELREFRRTRPHISGRELLELVTINPAAALGVTELGRLVPGSVADAVAVPFTGAAARVYDEVVDWAGAVAWVMVGGRAIATA
jgi:cytosine/adenosine deaminase-related metal-dependent hydrolase